MFSKHQDRIEKNKLPGSARLLFLSLLGLFVFFGCSNNGTDIKYPKRPKKAPYYYNETSITEMDFNAKYTLRRARERTGIEFVTVILEQIPENSSIENYAAGLFQEWKIGKNTGGRGVLLLFVENTQSLKIEVGYELESIFTDAYCSSFQPTIKCYYAGRYFGDVFCGLVTCLERRILEGTDFDINDSLKGQAHSPELLINSNAFLSGGGGILDDEYYYEKNAKLSFIDSISSAKIGEFKADMDIDVVLMRYFKSLEEGINYPFLGLLTEGSTMRRLEYPESAHFYRCRWQDCQSAFPYQIKYNGGLAAVRFAKPQSWPIFLRRTADDTWKVDEARAWVSSWQDFAGTESGPLHLDHPWMFAFQEYQYKKGLCRVPPISSNSVSLKDEILRLETAIKNEPGNPDNYFELADIFYWDCLWIAAAIDLTEKGLELDPQNVSYRWLAIFMRYRFPDPDPNAGHLEKLLEINPDDLEALDYYSRHHWYYTMNFKKAVKILRKVKNVEKTTTGDTFRYRWRLDSYKKDYWNAIEVDKNIVYRCWHYLCIFYSIDIILVYFVIISLIFLAFVAQLRKRRLYGKSG